MVRVIREKSFRQKISETFHDAKMFIFLALMALGAALTFYLLTQRLDIRQRASGNTVTEYGFNTHLNATSGVGYWENLNLDFFKKTVDDLVANNQKWIRFNLAPWESASSGNTTAISWNEVAMQKYDEAIQYADSKGLKIYLVTATPDFANSYSSSDYTETTKKYHSDLATRYKGKIDVWQIFNEADVHNFKGYALISSSELTSTYLSDFKTNFVAAKNAIKEIDGTVRFTSNVTGYPLDSATYQRWNTFYDILAPELDMLALDIYPRGTSDIPMLDSATIAVASRFSKPVIIAETGFPTGVGRFTETEQATLLSATLDKLRATQPIAILYYQYADTIPTTDITESSFGVVRADGTKKSSYDAVMQTMRIPTGLLRVQTDPAVGATITVTSESTGVAVLTKEWGVDWEKLPIGNYKITFSNPNNLKIYDKDIILPAAITVTIKANETTTVIADLSKGLISGSPTTTVTAQPPTSTPVPPTATLKPTATIKPTNTPTPSPKATTGLLRVTTSPPTAATIKILNLNGKVMLTKQWSVDWAPLSSGTYYITFSYPRTAGFTTPRSTSFSIYVGKTTEITGNFSTGKTSVLYK